jgi:hypothetical protein
LHTFNNVRMARRYRSRTSGANGAAAKLPFYSGKLIASKSCGPDTVTGMGTTPPTHRLPENRKKLYRRNQMDCPRTAYRSASRHAAPPSKAIE